MANKRIKDLATTASSAASDDFMALDGATNGTRKMSAANPSVTTLTTSGVIAPGGSVHGANGAVGNPSFAFLSDQDTGLYRIGANNIGVAANGAKVLDISTTGLGVTGAVTATTTLADQGGTIAAQRNGLAPAQGLVFTGGQDASVANVPASPDYFSIFMWVKLDETLADSGLWSGTAGFGIVTGSNQLQVNGGSAYYTATNGSALNEWACVGYTKSLTVGTFWLNGKSNGVVSDTDAWSGALVTYFNKRTFADGKKTISRPFIYNRALSAAEVLALYQSSAPAAADYGVSGYPAGTAAYTSDFSAGADSWSSAEAAVVTGNIDGINGQDNVLRAYANGANNVHGAIRNMAFVTAAAVGKLFRVTGLIYVPTGQTHVTSGNLLLGGQTSGDRWTLISGSANYSANASWQTIEAVVRINSVDAAYFYIYMNNASSFVGANSTTDDVVYIKNFVVTPLGLLLAPDSNNVGAGLEWLDVSGNRAHIILPTSGVSWSLPSSQQIVIEASTATNGNQQLGGASLIDANKQWRIQSWTVNCSTGTPTISLGNVSAGTQYNAVAVLAAGNNDITLVTRFPSTANLWVNSNSTATLIHRITLVPAN